MRHVRGMGWIMLVGGCLLTACGLPAGPQVTMLPGGGERVTLPAKQFAVDSPPPPWERVEPGRPSIDLKWRGPGQPPVSEIYITALRSCACALRAVAEVLAGHVRRAIQGESRGPSAVTVSEEREVTLDGRPFYLVLLDVTLTPREGIQVQAKAVWYLHAGPRFDYWFFMWSFLGEYHENRRMLERMVGSFTVVE